MFLALLCLLVRDKGKESLKETHKAKTSEFRTLCRVAVQKCNDHLKKRKDVSAMVM